MRRLRPGVRLGTTLAASAVVAVALAVGGLVLVVLVRAQLVDALDASARARAHDVAVLVTDQGVRGTLATTGEDAALVQVIGPTAAVIASTGNVQGEQPLIDPAKLRAPASVTRTAVPIGAAGERFRVVAIPVSLPDGPGWVYVGSSEQPVQRTVARLTGGLLLTLPVLLLLVGAVIHAAVGRGLRPVDRIRRRADELGARDLSQRVPVPPGRDAVARLALTMNQMLARLDSSARRQRQFVADASHELKSPLAALQTQLDVALSHPDAQDVELTMLGLRDQTTRMSGLIDKLLFLARAEERDEPPVPDRVDLDELVLTEVRRLRGQAATLPTAVSVTVHGPDAAQVLGSHADLGRLLGNLGDNALAHAESWVEIGLTAHAGRAVITVTDDGPGVPAEDRDRVFHRFTRLDWDRARLAGGSGLGLAIVAEITQAHGGHVQMLPRPDGAHGARVEVSLPLGAQP